MSFTDDEVERYARHLVLREVGGQGQKRLKAASVLIVGAGGLGDLAIRFGYQRFQTDVMVVTVLLLLALVQGLQWAGDRLVIKLSRR